MKPNAGRQHHALPQRPTAHLRFVGAGHARDGSSSAHAGRGHGPLLQGARRRRGIIGLLFAALLVIAIPTRASGGPALRVAYAGSMGVVMDLALGPAFAKAHHATWQGIGQGSYALARLLAAGQMRADVFVGITPGPVRVLERAGRITRAVPVASTRMVVIWSPKSRFSDDFTAAANGTKRWYDVLREPGVRLGRTNPAIDPQGANALLTLQLASRYYHQPKLLQQIAGALQNPHQIFSESSLMSRLEAGQIDAAIGYRSAALSHHLPTIDLPPEIDLAHPALQASWYAHARLTLAGGKTLHAQPLVFYAAVLDNARHPQLARAFVAYLQSAQGQKVLRAHGYDAPHGRALTGPAEKWCQGQFSDGGTTRPAAPP